MTDAALVRRHPSICGNPPKRSRRFLRRWIRHHMRKISDAGYRRACRRAAKGRQAPIKSKSHPTITPPLA